MGLAFGNCQDVDQNQSFFSPPFYSVLIIELGVVCFLRWPLLYNFDRFAFWDWGAYLVAHYLIQQGKMPVTDFGWQYGPCLCFSRNYGSTY